MNFNHYPQLKHSKIRTFIMMEFRFMSILITWYKTNDTSTHQLFYDTSITISMLIIHIKAQLYSKINTLTAPKYLRVR